MPCSALLGYYKLDMGKVYRTIIIIIADWGHPKKARNWCNVQKHTLQCRQIVLYLLLGWSVFVKSHGCYTKGDALCCNVIIILYNLV